MENIGRQIQLSMLATLALVLYDWYYSIESNNSLWYHILNVIIISYKFVTAFYKHQTDQNL